MNLKRYSDFIYSDFINENLDKSKKFLKERELLKKAASDLNFIDDDMAWKLKEGEKNTLVLNDFTPEQQVELKQKLRSMKLSEEEVKKIESEPNFLKLKELLKSNIGFLYNFVYMHYVEMLPLNEIELIYKDIIDYKDLIDRFKNMPDVGRKFDANFIDTSLPNEKEHRKNSEILVDGIEKLKEYRIVKKVIDSLPKKLRKSYEDAPPLLKEEMIGVARGFSELPEEMTEEGITKKERIWKNFFGEMVIDNDPELPDGKPNPNFGKNVFKSRLKRFEDMDNPIRDFLKAAKGHLESSLIDGYSERIEKIDKCNDRFGVLGCEIILNEVGIMIVKVNSWAANKFLNHHCNHCIVNYHTQWDNYLGEYNKQYYIYNFNISSMEDLSTIGVTIKPDRTWPSGGCQSMRNIGIGSKFKQILKDWEKEYSIETDLFQALEPMTKEEVDKRERAKLAEREIVRKGISIEKIKQYVTEDGADINKDSARALTNAVEEDDYEKAKFCLSLGASPNLSKPEDSPISKAKDFKMIKLLVSYGSDMKDKSIFKNMYNDPEALEYCLSAGLDPDFDFYTIRVITRGTYENKNKIGSANLDSFKLILKYGSKIFSEPRGRDMFAKYCSEYYRLEFFEFADENGYLDSFDNKIFESAIKWAGHANKLSKEQKEDVINYLKSKIK
jgi:hypothetical protein